MQSENLNIPVQKNIYQHKNIYFSTKRYISEPKNIFQSKKIYFSSKIYISIQEDLFQYQNIYFNPKIFISIQKSINIPQVSLRPAGRREVNLSKWRIWMDIQNEATTYYFKKLQIWNHISLLWKVSRYQNINANPKNRLIECGFTFTPAEADRRGMNLMKMKMLLWCIRTELDGTWLTTCCNFLVNIPVP